MNTNENVSTAGTLGNDKSLETRLFFHFGKIRQYNDAVHEMRHIDGKTNKFHHYRFFGTVKLHGTNAGIVVTKDDFYAQSRERVIYPEKDNYGFATWANGEEVKVHFRKIATELSNSWATADYIIFYGEWAGKKVQNSVAISQVDKFFAPFTVVLATQEDADNNMNPDSETGNDVMAGIGVELSGKGLEILRNEELRVFPLSETIEVVIKEGNFAEISRKLEELTNAADAECPFAKKYFDISGHGEGYVWVCHYNDGNINRRIRFKTKGEKHRVQKQKVAAPVDYELLENVNAFLDKYATQQRLEQGAELLRNAGKELTFSAIGELSKWLSNDIAQEAEKEIEMLEESKGIKYRQITKAIPQRVKQFLAKLNAL